MNGADAVACAVIFVWLGMVLAISFLEAPIKFRAPEVTLRIGLGIGRLVFRALNIAEAFFGAALVVALATGRPPGRVSVAAALAMAALVVQLVAIRPRLTKRSDAVLAGHDAPRSHSHYAYIALEATKVAALLVAGILLLAAFS
ncbi:MAG: hypothetical protein ACRDZ8_01620 [Acidimicrobiales bacterium]